MSNGESQAMDSAESSAEISDRYSRAIMNTFGSPALTIVRGDGSYIFDADGNKYLDLLAGIAVNSLGQAHPALVAAVTEQLSTLGHVSNFFATPQQVQLAEKLLELLGVSGRVFFANSGAEANEAALKLTRRTGRSTIISTHGAFHGRTMGALSLTSKEGYRAPFEPLPPQVRWAPYGDAEAVERMLDESVAAIVVEPIQGEAGVVVPGDDYLARLREITHRHGVLLWIDEVQTGVGRTGDWFAHTSAGIVPDIVTLAKGLGGGFPIGACIASNETGSLFRPGDHGTTFGGNPVAAAAALAVIETIESCDLLRQVQTVSRILCDGLLALPQVADIEGRGLMLGVVLDGLDAAEVVVAARQTGIVTNAPTADRLRLVPPLTLSVAEAGEAITGLAAALQKVAQQ